MRSPVASEAVESSQIDLCDSSPERSPSPHSDFSCGDVDVPLNSELSYTEELRARSQSSAAHMPPLPLVPPMYGEGAVCTQLGVGLLYIPFSVVSQIDGCMHSLLGLRIERDVTASSASASCCRDFGCPPHMSWSSFIGIHFPGIDDGKLTQMVDTAVLHHSLGVYIVPFAPHKSWYQSLVKARLLEFDVPSFYGDPFTPPQPSQQRFVVFVSRFGWFGRLKGTRRPERFIPLKMIPEIECLGRDKIPAIPFLISRSSPIPSPPIPLSADTIPDAEPFIVAPGVTPPSAAASTWKPGVFEAAAATFPFADVREMAQSAVREGIDPYHGRTDKAVFHENRRMAPDLALRCRTQYMADVVKGFSAGPFPSCPYKFARVCWWFYVMKDKNNPDDPRIRLISHHSKGDKAGNGSVNSLCTSPRMIGVHHSALTIKTLIAMCGKGAQALSSCVGHSFLLQTPTCQRPPTSFVRVQSSHARLR